jgi:hypothetical protein
LHLFLSRVDTFYAGPHVPIPDIDIKHHSNPEIERVNQQKIGMSKKL